MFRAENREPVSAGHGMAGGCVRPNQTATESLVPHSGA